MRANVAVGTFTFTPMLGGRCAFLLFRFLRHPVTSRFWLLCALVSRGPMCIIYPPSSAPPRMPRERFSKNGKNRYDRVMKPWPMFSQIKAALDNEDIEGLMAFGCPADEYNGEASLIEGRIAKLTRSEHEPLGEAEVERIVAEVRNEEFGPFSDEDLQERRSAFTSVARKIIGS